MKKFYLLTKTLLVAALLMVGANAWAGDEWSIDFIAMYQDAGFSGDKTVTISSEVAKIDNVSMGTCSVEGVSINSKFILQTGTKWLLRTGGLYQFNGGGRAMGMLGCTAGQIITIVGTGNPNPSTNATLKSQDGNTYVYTVNADGDVKFTPARYLYFTSITVENPSASAVKYTVKYVDEGGTEIKESTQGEGEVGAGITLTSSEKKSFLNNDETKKYIYKSDDSDGKKIASDGSTVVTITFREAATWKYTLNSSLGTKISDGSAFEEDVVYIAYPRYILQEKTLYEAGTTDKEYRKEITLDEDNKVETVTYTKSINNVVFYSEGENLSGVTETIYGNIPVRASNAKAAKTAEDVNITTLAAGKYKFYVGAFTSASKDYENYIVKIGVGDKVFAATVSGANLNVVTSEYDVEDGTQIKYLADGSGDNSALDYIVIEQIPESVSATITSAGYATYCSPYALDFSEVSGLKAYIITGTESGNTLALSAVKEVPANTGVLLEGEVGNYDIPVVASSSTDVSANKLVGVTAKKEIAAEAGYVLMDEDAGVGFYKNNKAFTVGANTAYLPANFAGGAAREAYFFDGATDVEAVEAASEAVAKEGKFIVDGKLRIFSKGKMFNANGQLVK